MPTPPLLPPQLDAGAVEALLARNLPPVDHRGERVESVEAGRVRVRLPVREDWLSRDVAPGVPGPILSAPVMMGFADTALYACIHAHYGEDVLAVIVNLNLTCLAVAGDGDLVAEAALLRRGKRLAMTEAHLFSGETDSPCAHVTATYAIRPLDD